MSAVAARQAASDVRIIGLIGAGHYFSHFFQLVLPPLFPVLKDVFGVSYAELGIAMTAFYATSGLMQTPAGFLVDRFGPRAVLLFGLALLSSAVGLLALVPSYGAMVGCAMLAGFGNSVFHPADYAILTARIDRARLARAYSVHTLGGNLDWATAPVVVLTLSHLFGSWRLALLAVALAGLTMTLCLAVAADLEIRAGGRRREEAGAAPAPDWRILFAAPVLLCFGYFALLSTSMIGIQNFLPSTLNVLYGTPIAAASAALTAFLFGGSAGVLTGGVIADRYHRHDFVVAAGLCVGGVVVLAIGLVEFETAALATLAAIAGFAFNITIPSRDMLVRNATPAGSAGKVFGFVYSGLDLGAALGPAIIGTMLDHGLARAVFFFLSAIILATVVAALVVRRASPAPALISLPAE
jgi:MFS family permease